MAYNRAIQEITASKSHPFHNDLHTPVGDEKIGSVFYDPVQKSTWYSNDDRVELKRTGENGTYTFLIPESVSRLLSVTMTQDLPALEVSETFKDTIRIAYTPNAGIAIVEEGVLLLEDAETYPLSKHWIKVQSMYNVDENHVETIEDALGNRCPELTEFSNKLPKRQVGAIHPWYFTYRKGGLNVNIRHNVRFRYTVLHEVQDILRVQSREPLPDGGYGPWVDRDDFQEEWLKAIEPLPAPTMTGECCFNTMQEMEYYKCDEEYVEWITDVFEFQSTNPVEDGKKITEVISKDNPCKAIFACAENVRARELKYHCNYTSCPTNVSSGVDPVKLVMLKYDQKRRLVDRNDSVATKLVNTRHFKCSPREPGFRANALCNRPFDAQESGVVLSALQSTINIDLMQLPHDQKSKFIIHIFLLVQRKVTYKVDDEKNWIPNIQ